MSVSFARNAEDIEEARSLLRAAGGQAHIVAKIERAEAVQNIRSIIDASDVSWWRAATSRSRSATRR